MIAINASGAAPAGLTIDSMHASGGRFVERGPSPLPCPGLWAAGTLSELGSRFGFRNAFEPPQIDLAANGLPVARSLAAAIANDKQYAFSADSRCASTFYPKAHRFGKATAFANPRWHSTLAALANEGPLPSTAGRSGAPRSTPGTLAGRQ